MSVESKNKGLLTTRKQCMLLSQLDRSLRQDTNDKQQLPDKIAIESKTK